MEFSEYENSPFSISFQQSISRFPLPSLSTLYVAMEATLAFGIKARRDIRRKKARLKRYKKRPKLCLALFEGINLVAVFYSLFTVIITCDSCKTGNNPAKGYAIALSINRQAFQFD